MRSAIPKPSRPRVGDSPPEFYRSRRRVLRVQCPILWRLHSVVAVLILSTASLVADRYGAKADPGSRSSLDVSMSYGLFFERDAYFWGPSVSYAQAIGNRWGFSLSLAFDQEIERTSDGTRTKVHSFTGIGTVYYLVTERLSLATGIGKGFANDANQSQRIEFADGDWGTGLSAGFTLYSKGDFAVGLNTTLEYNISQQEWAMSWDLGVGFAF